VPYIYEQNPAILVIRLMPWAIILLLMLIPAKNRNWRAWLVLVPALAVYGVLLLLRFGLFADSLSFSFPSQIIVALATGLVVLGLMSYKLETYNTPTILLIAAGIMTVAGCIIIASFSFPGFNKETHHMLIMYMYGAVTLLGGLSITGYHTHRNFTTDYIVSAFFCFSFRKF